MDPDRRPPASSAAYYDSVAESWDTSHGADRQNQYFAGELRSSLKTLLAGGGPVALELGAGTGAYVDVTAPLFEKLIATDVSRGMLDVFARRLTRLGLTNVTLLQQDACDLRDIASASIDVVYAIGLLEHIDDFDRLFAETCRVLKPGGFVAGITSNGDCPWYAIRKRLEGDERHSRTGRFATAAALDAILQRNGFRPAEIAYWGAVPPGFHNRVAGAMLYGVGTAIAGTPLARYLGVLSFRSQKSHATFQP